MSEISAAERKRLQSLKEKKQVYQKREQIIQKALANSYHNNKKIIFDNNFGEQPNLKSERKEKEKINLFEDDDSNEDGNEDALWNENTFNARKPKKVVLGYDARFTLDERFIENNHQNKTEVIADAVKCDLQKEKERELDILKSVLGAPLTIKIKKTETSKKELMIRYDPTEKKHCEYEMKPAESKINGKSTKEKKHEKAKTKELVPVEISKDIYYTVSDTLTESLKQNKPFSLLKACRREKNDVDDHNIENSDISMRENNMDGQFRFHFVKNTFKHDSSYNENPNETFDGNEQVIEQSENDNHKNNLFGYKDTLFFENDDIRFNEAVRFFNTETISNNGFKNLRRELKVIIRTKIRKNERKYQPWNKKIKIKRT